MPGAYCRGRLPWGIVEAMRSADSDEFQVTVWRAEGVLMQRLGIDGREALDLLVQEAHDREQTLSELSAQVLESRGLP
jgi:AmiR/NasT family two-component response regulator